MPQCTQTVVHIKINGCEREKPIVQSGLVHNNDCVVTTLSLQGPQPSFHIIIIAMHITYGGRR